MRKITSAVKGFLFVGLVMTVGAVTTSFGQSSEDHKWKGPRAGCPGGYYLDYFPAWELLVEADTGTSNGDGLVCIRELKIKGELSGYRIQDNVY